MHSEMGTCKIKQGDRNHFQKLIEKQYFLLKSQSRKLTREGQKLNPEQNLSHSLTSTGKV